MGGGCRSQRLGPVLLLLSIAWNTALFADESTPPDARAPAAPGLSAPAPDGDGPTQDHSTPDPDGILDLDIEQLAKVDVVAPALDVEVTTVNRTPSTVGRTPAAVFVLTNEMIRRSGARTIPDALRLVPGVQVAQINAHKWAISIRGFNGQFANKLLVQIDGRNCYTPLYGGVYWDAQDVVLEDVERIEVIRGPGATVWGANAVNGVVNVITKPASETQGGLVQAGGGSEEFGSTTARYGGKIGEQVHYRVYGKWLDRGPGYSARGEANDGWDQGRTGMRFDWTPNTSDTITFQGDYYDGHDDENDSIPPPPPHPPISTLAPPPSTDNSHLSGGNTLVRWSRDLDEETGWSLQLYYDRLERHRTESPRRYDQDMIDLDYQYRFPVGGWNALVTGCGYRNTRDWTAVASTDEAIADAGRADDLFSYFIQDEITVLEDRLYFTAGSKFEHNDYTGFEFQPSVRLLWTPSEHESVWWAISRAVRTPSRYEGDIGLDAEELLAYETGIRGQPADEFSWDLALFYNCYQDLFARERPTPDAPFPLLANALGGQSYGIELAATYQLTPVWQVRGSYTALWLFLQTEEDVDPVALTGSDPQNQFSLWLSGNPNPNWDLDFVWRYVDALSAIEIPSYLVMDVRLAWHPRKNLEWFVSGRNLLDSAHPEFAETIFDGSATEVQPEGYGGVTWRF